MSRIEVIYLFENLGQSFKTESIKLKMSWNSKGDTSSSWPIDLLVYTRYLWLWLKSYSFNIFAKFLNVIAWILSQRSLSIYEYLQTLQTWIHLLADSENMLLDLSEIISQLFFGLWWCLMVVKVWMLGWERIKAHF